MLFAFAMVIPRRSGFSLILPLGVGVGLLAAGVAPLIWTERHSGAVFQGIGRRVAAQFIRGADEQGDKVQHECDDVFDRTRRLGLAAVIHFGGWMAGGIAVWIGYRLLDAHVEIVSVMALEGRCPGDRFPRGGRDRRAGGVLCRAGPAVRHSGATFAQPVLGVAGAGYCDWRVGAGELAVGGSRGAAPAAGPDYRVARRANDKAICPPKAEPSMTRPTVATEAESYASTTRVHNAP